MNINWAPAHMPAVGSFWVWNREENMLEINQSPSFLWPFFCFFFFFFLVWWRWGCGDTSLTSVGYGGSLEAQAAFLCCCPQKTSDFALKAFNWLDKAHPHCWEYPLCCCSVTQACPTLCDPMDCSAAGFPVHHHLLELAQTHVHQVGDAIQPSHPLSSPSPPAFNLS